MNVSHPHLSHSSTSDSPRASALGTSQVQSSLLGAALLGLLGLPAGACSLENDEPIEDATADTTTQATSTMTVGETTTPTDHTDHTDETNTDSSSTTSTHHTDIDTNTATGSDSSSDSTSTTTGPEIISTVEGNRTYASLREECDMRGGFIEIHGACGGVNSCRGFSYGDWDPGVLTEHTCAGANGCNGLSCIIGPEDMGKSGKEVYEAEAGLGEPSACFNCHTPWGDDGPDLTKFKVYVLPDSGRTLENWLEISPVEQAHIIGLGRRGVLPDGTAYSNMSAYHKIWSRAEIERTVAYIRSELTPELHEIKLKDPE